MAQHQTVRKLLDTFGQTYADELGMKLDTPSGLFQLLCFTALAANRVQHEIASDALRSLKGHGLTTAEHMANSTWGQRRDALHEGRYGQYEEQGSDYLGDIAALAMDRYRGDLRNLRDAAERKPDRERELLGKFKGIGSVGVDIFMREAQAAWDELAGFHDKKAAAAAKKLDIDPDALPELGGDGAGTARLVAALVRCDLEDGYGRLQEA